MIVMLTVVVRVLLFISTFSISEQMLNASAANNNCSFVNHQQPNSSYCMSSPLVTLKLLVLLPHCKETESFQVEERTPWQCSGDDNIILSALNLAVEQINNRSDFLPCHKLELVHKEAGCEITTSTLVGLTSGLFPSNPERSGVIGVIGPTCSLSALQVSTITNRPEVQMVLLHSSSSSLLTNREKYPLSLGILGSLHQSLTC